MPPTPEMTAAIAKLEARLDALEDWTRSIAEDTKAMRRTLDRADGGMSTARWIFGAGSLAGLIAVFAGLYTWFQQLAGRH